MKKIILLFAIFLSVQFSFAQEEIKEQKEETKKTEKYTNLGGSFLLSDFSNISVFLEEQIGKTKTTILRAGFASATLSNGFTEVTGNGYTSEIAFREYYGKNKNQFKGFFSENTISYTSIEFDEDFYKGKYRHFSFVNPTVGYKFQWGNFTLDGRAGYQWVIMIKGKGDVDNNAFNTWIFNMGLQLGYSF